MPIFGLAGQADLITIRRNKYNILDHKTATGTSANYMASWGHDFGMIGYCYGVAKLLKHNITRYGMNIIKKLKTAEKTTKCCPDCRNGKIKKQTCETCEHTGSVPMEPVKPFYREYFRVTPQDYHNMIQNRVALGLQMYHMHEAFERRGESINAHTYPMHSISCHKYGRECGYAQLCWNNEPDNQWFEFPNVMLSDYGEKEPDYVDRLVKEDMA
jgi:hypothetical protein